MTGAYELAVQRAGGEDRLREKLLVRVQREGSWAAVARAFGVSRQTMVHWRGYLGIGTEEKDHA